MDDLKFLQPYKTGDELLSLSSGEQVKISKYSLAFIRWTGFPMPNTYNKKPVIDWRGEPLFAELAVLRLFQSHGWNGVWVDSYGRKLRTGLPDLVDPINLPQDQARLLGVIKACRGDSGGCWDVFAWKDDSVAFVELNRRGKDRIQINQIRWFEQGRQCGLDESNFLLIEWTFV